MIKPAFQWFRTANWARLGGPLLTAATAISLTLLSRHGFPPQNSSSVLVLVVAFSAFAGGLGPGLASAVFSWIYFALAFSRPGHPLHYDPDDLERLLVVAAIIPVIVIMVGVLHRRTTEQLAAQLRESEQRFKAFMDNSPTVAWIKDDQGRYVYVNAPYELTFNVRHGEIVGNSGPEPWTPDTARQLAENERAVLESGKPRQLYETLAGSDNLRQHWWLLQFPVDAGPGQRFVGGMAVDITERKQAEEERDSLLLREREARAQSEAAVRVLEEAREALRASEEHSRSLADLIPGIVWTARADGGIDYANQFWLDFTGMTLEQTLGSGWTAALHPDDVEKVSRVWTRALETGQPVEIDYRLRRADGVYRRFLARGKPRHDREGRVVKWFGILTELHHEAGE